MRLISNQTTPYSIVHATQFFEFIAGIEDGATERGTVRLPSVLFQPVAAGDVALTVSEAALGRPVMGIIEVAGPEQFRFDELIRRDLVGQGDSRPVVTDPHARYFGTELEERSLVPSVGARLGKTTYEQWFAQAMSRTS